MKNTGTSNFWVLIALVGSALLYAPYWLDMQHRRQNTQRTNRSALKLLILALYIFIASFYGLAILQNTLGSPSHLLSILIDMFGISFYVTLVICCVKYGNEIATDNYPKPNWVAIFLFHVLYINDWQNSEFRGHIT